MYITLMFRMCALPEDNTTILIMTLLITTFLIMAILITPTTGQLVIMTLLMF